MFSSCRRSELLVAGVKIGSGRRSDSRSPAGSWMPQTVPVCLDSPSSRSRRDSRARHTRQGTSARASPAWSGLPAGRGKAAAPRISSTSAVMRWLGTMSLRKSNQKSESCVRILPLSGNAGGEHVIKGRDAVRGDKQQRLADGVEVAHLAARVERQGGEIGFNECWQRGPLEEWLNSDSVFPGALCQRRKKNEFSCASFGWFSLRLLLRAQQREEDHVADGFEPVSSIVRRSMPMPSPAVGGMP